MIEALVGPLLQPLIASAGASILGRFALAPQALVVKALTVLLCAALCAYGGWRLRAAFDAQERIEAINLQRAEEQRGVKLVVKTDSRLVRQLNQQRSRSDELQTRLTLALNGMERCAVAPNVARVFNQSSTIEPARTERDLTPARAPAQEPGAVDAREIIAVCQWNYTNVCIPNALQLDALRSFYEEMRRGH